MYYSNVLDLIGNTPLMSLEETTGLNIYAKAEFLNPGGSIKDRIAKNMLDVAEAEGKLKKGMTITQQEANNLLVKDIAKFEKYVKLRLWELDIISILAL